MEFGFGVSLSALNSDHLEYMRDWRNDRRVWRWCRQNDVISKSAHADWFERQEKDPTIRMYAVYDEDSGFVGVAGLTSIDWINRRAEFSLYIGPENWGRGLGEKALRTLFSHGFYNLGLNVIWGESFDGNPAMKVFDKLLMLREGARREFYYRDGKFIDAVLFSITRSEWDKQCPT